MQTKKLDYSDVLAKIAAEDRPCKTPPVSNPAILTQIKNTLQEALNLSNNQELINQYTEFLRLISELRTLLFSEIKAPNVPQAPQTPEPELEYPEPEPDPFFDEEEPDTFASSHAYTYRYSAVIPQELLARLNAYTDPRYAPISQSIQHILNAYDNDAITPQCIRIKLHEILFGLDEQKLAEIRLFGTQYDPTQLNSILNSARKAAEIAQRIDGIVRGIAINLLAIQGQNEGLQVPDETGEQPDSLDIPELPEEVGPKPELDWNMAGGQVKKFYEIFKLPPPLFSQFKDAFVHDALNQLDPENKAKIMKKFDLTGNGGDLSQFGIGPARVQGETPEQLTENVWWLLYNLDAMNRLFREGFIQKQRGKSITDSPKTQKKERMEQLLQKTQEYMDKAGVSPDQFLSQIATDADYLARIARDQQRWESGAASSLYPSGIHLITCPHCKKKNKIHESESGNEAVCKNCGQTFQVPMLKIKPKVLSPSQMAKLDIEGNPDEFFLNEQTTNPEKLYPHSADQQKFFSVLANAGIENPKDVTALHDWFYDSVIKEKILPEVLNNKDLYSDPVERLTKQTVSKPEEEMLKSNSAGMNYSFTQFKSLNNEFIRSINQYQNAEDDTDLAGNVTFSAEQKQAAAEKELDALFRLVFPDTLMNQARESMKQNDPDTFKMLTLGRPINSTRNANNKQPVNPDTTLISTGWTLFVPFKDYNETISEMTTMAKNARIGEKQEFRFCGRATLGLWMAMVYGGGYRATNLSEATNRTGVYNNVYKINPNYPQWGHPSQHKPYRLCPLPCLNLPFWNKGDEKTHIIVGERVNKRIEDVTLQMLQSNPQDKEKTLLYMALRSASTQTELTPEESIKEWMTQYKILLQKAESGESIHMPSVDMSDVPVAPVAPVNPVVPPVDTGTDPNTIAFSTDNVKVAWSYKFSPTWTYNYIV